jgi:hypothetical protein
LEKEEENSYRPESGEEQKQNGSAYSQLRGDAAYYSNPWNCKSCVLICKKKTLKEQRSLDPQKYA